MDVVTPPEVVEPPVGDRPTVKFTPLQLHLGPVAATAAIKANVPTMLKNVANNSLTKNEVSTIQRGANNNNALLAWSQHPRATLTLFHNRYHPHRNLTSVPSVL